MLDLLKDTQDSPAPWSNIGGLEWPSNLQPTLNKGARSALLTDFLTVGTSLSVKLQAYSKSLLLDHVSSISLFVTFLGLTLSNRQLHILLNSDCSKF